jgi:hypothetical protein
VFQSMKGPAKWKFRDDLIGVNMNSLAATNTVPCAISTNRLPKQMPRALFYWQNSPSVVLASILTLAGVLPAHGATVLEKKVVYDLGPGGQIKEYRRLRVKLETPSDLDRWDSYSIYLDENRHLVNFEGWVTSPAGRRSKVGRKQQDKVEYTGGGTLYDSSHYHLVEFDGLEVGSTLEITFQVREDTYFPSEQVGLLGSDPITNLEVSVRGASAAWRWRLDGPATDLEVQATEGGVRVTGKNLAAFDPSALAAGGGASQPVLRFAWGGGDSWQDIGLWYRDLLAEVPRNDTEIQQLAARLTQGSETPRQRLEALLAYMRQKVRYVAIEVGIGGYRPSAPGDVLNRKWGDCKDKSILLVDLLRAVDITSHPALIRSDTGSRIDAEFPSPNQFNHVIVAVPGEQLELTEDDPTAGGFLFLDPTQTRGAAGWLHPAVQDQQALVVDAEGGRLTRLPVRPQYESRVLALDLEITPEGNAIGRAGLRLSGRSAARFLHQMENAPPERTAEDVRSIFSHLLPGSRLSEVGWSEEEGDVPQMRMAMAVEIDGLVEGLESARSPSFRMVGLSATPEPRDIADLETPAAISANIAKTIWRLRLPEGWCKPAEGEKVTETTIGDFRQTTTHDDSGHISIERTTEITQPWVGVEDLGELKKLALAEHRAAKRRIRLQCAEDG